MAKHFYLSKSRKVVKINFNSTQVMKVVSGFTCLFIIRRFAVVTLTISVQVKQGYS